MQRLSSRRSSGIPCRYRLKAIDMPLCRDMENVGGAEQVTLTFPRALPQPRATVGI